MSRLRSYLEGIASVDWSKRVANIYAFVCAMAVYIAWPLIPFPTLHYVVGSVDLVGTLLSASACGAAAIFMLGSRGWKAAGELSSYLTYALLVATVLLWVSIAFSIRTIVVQGGVNLDVVLLFVALVAFMRVGQVTGFWGVFFSMFFLVGIPLLMVDLYFGLAIHVTFQIPYDALILGGGGLNDGLNKMFFMVLGYSASYHLLVTRFRERLEEIGNKYFGEEGGGEVRAPPQGSERPPEAPFEPEGGGDASPSGDLAPGRQADGFAEMGAGTVKGARGLRQPCR